MATIRNDTPVRSAQEIIDEAAVVWDKVCKKAIANDKKSGPWQKETLEQIWRDHREFYQSYSLVVSMMLEGMYHPEALADHLTDIVDRGGWKSFDDYLDSNVSYVARLIRMLSPNAPQSEVDAVCRQIRAHLATEVEQFKTHLEDTRKKVEEEEAERARRQKTELRDFMRNNQQSSSNGQ